MSTSTESAQLAGRASWSGKLAFVLSAAASAVGLGAMWRFPYLAAKYGGGMFLFVYLVLVFTIGISLLLLENALGRKTGQSAIGAFKAFGKKFTFIGVLTRPICLPYVCRAVYHRAVLLRNWRLGNEVPCSICRWRGRCSCRWWHVLHELHRQWP